MIVVGLHKKMVYSTGSLICGQLCHCFKILKIYIRLVNESPLAKYLSVTANVIGGISVRYLYPSDKYLGESVVINFKIRY
jgi:hypothetical protein